MKKKIILFLLTNLFTLSLSYATNPFKMKTIGDIMETISIGKAYGTNASFSIPKKLENIVGVSIDGNIVRNDAEFLVRIILKDKQGKEYLIFESYKEIADGWNIPLVNSCYETACLDGIIPDSLKIIAQGVSIMLDKINFSKVENIKESHKLQARRIADDTRFEQAKFIVERINNFNIANNKLWRAGITPLSLMSYEEKKSILGFSDTTCTNGFEYYTDGVFEMGNSSQQHSQQVESSQYINNFSWCNKHGRNWMSPNKSQGVTNSCVIFTTIACVEAMTNLYFNKKIDLDLSEEELTCCGGLIAPNKNGVNMDNATMSKLFGFLSNHGVCDETAYPFMNDTVARACNSDNVNPSEIVKINGYGSVQLREDSLKKAIINNGPLISGVKWKWPDGNSGINHAMLLVGYGVLQEGDTIYRYINENGVANGDYTVKKGDPRIGHTYWIYKNSYGSDMDEARDGYMWIIHYDLNKSMNPSYYCSRPIKRLGHTDNEIVCEDRDGDGYYNWGIGPKPVNSPSWIPEIPDGDDSDYSKGPIDEFGKSLCFSEHINDTIYINSDNVWDKEQFVYSHVVIENNATLTISNKLHFYGGVKLILNGGCVLVDNGELINAEIEIKDNAISKIVIGNNGIIELRNKKELMIPLDNTLYINSGEIKIK